MKVDAEGAECYIVCGSPIVLWRCVDEVFIEWHSFAPREADELVRHLGRAGLRPTHRARDPETELMRLSR